MVEDKGVEVGVDTGLPRRPLFRGDGWPFWTKRDTLQVPRKAIDGPRPSPATRVTYTVVEGKSLGTSSSRTTGVGGPGLLTSGPVLEVGVVVWDGVEVKAPSADVRGAVTTTDLRVRVCGSVGRRVSMMRILLPVRRIFVRSLGGCRWWWVRLPRDS